MPPIAAIPCAMSRTIVAGRLVSYLKKLRMPPIIANSQRHEVSSRE
jgi:hypothetical protein